VSGPPRGAAVLLLSVGVTLAGLLVIAGVLALVWALAG
jgi:hypothetical protein